jgi:general secretion pathway protein D
VSELRFTRRTIRAFGILCVAVPALRAQSQVRPSGTPAQATPAQVTPAGIVVDFQDTELRYVISALAEAAGLNVVYGDLPSKRTTLRLRQPVPKENIPALLRSLAQSNGLVVTDEGGLLRIEAVDALGQRGGPTRSDAASQGGGQDLRLYVYRLRHARAPKLAATLQSLFGGGRGMGAGAGRDRPTLSDRLRSYQIPPLAMSETQPPMSSRTEDPALGATSSLPGQLQGDVQIVPEETTNSLLVRANPSDWSVIRQAIVSLDLRPLQVIIEVLIAEVRHTDDFNFGMAGSGADASTSDRSFKRTGTFGGLAPGPTDFVMRLIRSNPDNVSVTLNALAATGAVRIVSRPVIFAQNNLEARILVGSERPFVQVSRSLPTDAAVRDQVIQYRDVGTKLLITPTINPDGYVNLQVTQEVSNATNETQFGAPVISTREASTHVFIRDGQTGVIGGLIDREQDRSRSGIPVLSSIPFLGGLFGTTKITTLNNELFLFLTPHIVTSDEDTDRVREAVEVRTKEIKDATQDNQAAVPSAPRRATPITMSPVDSTARPPQP